MHLHDTMNLSPNVKLKAANVNTSTVQFKYT